MRGDDLSVGDTVLACPECDSSSVKTNAASDPRGPRGANKHRCEACGHTFDDQDAVRRPHKKRPLPRGDTIARQLLDADPDDLATDGGHGNHYNVDAEQPSSEDENDVVLERRATIQRHDDGGLLIPDGGTEDKYVPGTCDHCGHDREYTRSRDGQVICILCEDGVTDAAQEDDLVTDGGQEIGPSADGIERERRGPQLVSPLTSRQKSASPQVHSGAIPIGFIVPSDLSIAENKAPQERHFAKHRGAESGSDIAVLVILSHITNGCCDFKGNWIEGGDQSLFIDIEDDSTSGSRTNCFQDGDQR